MFYQPEENSAKKLLEALGVAREYLDNSSERSTKKRDKKSELKKKYVNTGKILKMVHRELLSRPPCRRLQSRPNPNVQDSVGVTRAAVEEQFWSRLDYLAEPRKEKINFETYYPRSQEKSRKNERKKIISSRLNELSRPKPFIDTEEKIERKRFESKEAWFAHLEKLKVLGAARKTPPSPLPPKRIKKPLNTILPHLEILSKPASRPINNNEKTYEELYTVKSSALKYIASDRIQELAVPRPLNEETIQDMNYDPYEKLLNAKKYIASERILQLAQPIIRTAPKQTDIKLDAFRVNPKALKAWCSPRIKKLAQHIVRK